MDSGSIDSWSIEPEPAGAGSAESEPVGAGSVEPEPAGAGAAFGARVQLARRYVTALSTDGVVRGLIGPREPARVWTRHVMNSAAVSQLIGQRAAVVDIGSGAGLPGIPLAIARPDLLVTLVEPLERRFRFLLEVVESLGLTNCRAIRGRAEDVVIEAGGADVVTSRAVAPLHRLVAWSAPLIRPDGLLLAMKGASAAEELARDAAAVRAAGLADAEVVELTDGAAGTTYVIRARRSGLTGPGAGRRPPRHRRSR